LPQNRLGLAELPQPCRKTVWGLRNFRNLAAKLFEACGTSATLPQNRLRLAELSERMFSFCLFIAFVF